MMRTNLLRAGVLAMLCLNTAAVQAQKGKKEKDNKKVVEAGPAVSSDTTRKASKPKVKAYKDVITAAAVTAKGLITVHRMEDKFYYEIPFALFNRDVLIINRIAEGPVNMNVGERSEGYAGDGVGGNIIHFEKGPGDKLFIRKMFYTDYSSDSTKPMYNSVKKNSIQPIIAAFPVAAYNADSTALVVDMTDFINSDNELFYFSSPIFKLMMHLGNQMNDKSYIKSVRTFPNNVEIRAVKSYSLGGTTYGGSTTMELNSSMVLLPEKPMKGRLYDARVGYFANDFIDFDANPQGVKEVSLVSRWKLEPKPEDVQRYLKGELVEPQKQIVFYIDPTTPAKWVPYLMKGVNDWQVAFEKAGFKNAIVAKLAPTPEQDSTFSMEDARHSVIVYKPSAIANASGPHIADPRSGEIMESHINWYHNVMSLIHHWYMVQCAATDTAARKMEFSDELMGQLIRFVSSHEVGHTLGLRHNFGSSSTVSVENLRNKAWVEEHGHTPSIMDYARFNYVAQPEDNISEKGLFPRIGDYDIWAIEWGYKWYPDSVSMAKETEVLSMLTTEKAANKRLWFGTEISPNDPRSQNEDLSDDAMKANAYGIKNLKRIVPHLVEWTTTPHSDYSNLAEMYGAVNKQFDRYLVHVIKFVGGTYETPKTTDQPGAIYEPVSKEKQVEAMEFIDEQLLRTPMWLLDKDIAGKLNVSPLVLMGQRQDGVLGMLVHNARLSKLLAAEALYGDKAFTVKEFFAILNKAVWTELYQHKTSIDIYRRNMQKMYLDKLVGVAFPGPVNAGANVQRGPQQQRQSDLMPAQYNDNASLVKGQLKVLLQQFKVALPLLTDKDSKDHIQDMMDRITQAFKENK